METGSKEGASKEGALSGAVKDIIEILKQEGREGVDMRAREELMIEVASLNEALKSERERVQQLELALDMLHQKYAELMGEHNELLATHSAQTEKYNRLLAKVQEMLGPIFGNINPKKNSS